MSFLLTVAAIWLALRLFTRTGSAADPRTLAENHLVQMFLVARNLRQRYSDEADESSAQLASVRDLNESADRLIREQFNLRPYLRANDPHKHEGLLQLGSRLCHELNDMLLISSAEDVPQRLGRDRVTASELERELHGLALRRLRSQG
jgi:hypothetical protein